MKLVDADKELQERFFLSSPDRVIILDPGTHSNRLHIGRLQRGFAFWVVGDDRIANYDQLVSHLLAECQKPQKEDLGGYSCRVVYEFKTANFSGTNTQYMHLTERDVQELRAEAKQSH